MWTKNGSIPQPDTDGTEGWIEAPMPPDCPDGKEVVWLNWQWVVRDPKPVDRPGYQWNWIHDQMAWVEYPIAQAEALTNEPLPQIDTNQLAAMSSASEQAISSQQISAFE